MLGVTPYIVFRGNCRDAIEFYKGALGAEVLFVQTIGEAPMQGMGPAENIMHCTMKVGDSAIMMSDDPSPEGEAAGGNISLAIGVDNVDQAHQMFKNLAQGGSVIMPLGKTYWAEAFGMLTDKFGTRWMVNCEAPKEA
jgi:PhnB protein